MNKKCGAYPSHAPVTQDSDPQQQHLTSQRIYFYRDKPKKANAPVVLIQPYANPSSFVMDTHEPLNWCPILASRFIFNPNSFGEFPI